MQIREKEALSFDDVLLVPKFFPGKSRKEVNLSTLIAGLELKLPIISANMPSVTSDMMALYLSKAGGLGILDRMSEPKYDVVAKFKKSWSNDKIGVSIGIGDDCLKEAAEYIKCGADIICIDVAHGDQKKVYEVHMSFRNKFDKFPLIVGNFAGRVFPTLQSDIFTAIKLGVGGGSVCTTRIQTGCGVPTLQSILDCKNQFGDSPIGGVIADGGIKNSGDIVKSLAAGAKAVMLGSLLAGTDQAPGAVFKDDKTGRKFKVYRGNASYGTKADSEMPAEFIEGAETLVSYKGSVEKILKQLEQGIRSGITYCGAINLSDLRRNAEFIKISPAGYKESLPHGTL